MVLASQQSITVVLQPAGEGWRGPQSTLGRHSRYLVAMCPCAPVGHLVSIHPSRYPMGRTSHWLRCWISAVVAEPRSPDVPVLCRELGAFSRHRIGDCLLPTGSQSPEGKLPLATSTCGWIRCDCGVELLVLPTDLHGYATEQCGVQRADVAPQLALAFVILPRPLIEIVAFVITQPERRVFFQVSR